jgi:hypothetical protein
MELPTAEPRRQVLLVLGMHRSGTSATAGLLARLGARMAATPIRADANNPHGYWEPEPVVSLHNRLLEEAGSAWNDWGPLDPARIGGAGGGARAALAAAFTAEFGTDFDLAVLKDPRICRFLPLWQRVLADVGAEPLAVLPLRHPLEVAGSLARRDGMAEEEALLLWLRHALDAEAGTRALPRAFLGYADLVADWHAAAGRLAATLGIAWPVDPEAARPEVEIFLSRDLRHHAADPDAPLPAWAAEGWAALGALAGGDAGALARLDALRSTLDDGDALMGVAARRQARRAAEQAEEAANRAAAAAALQAEAAADRARHEAERAGLATRLATAETALAAQAAEVAAAREETAALAARAAAAEAAQAAAEGARATAEAGRAAEAAERAAERAAFLASRSWRLTAPLRRAGGLLRRVRRPAGEG